METNTYFNKLTIALIEGKTIDNKLLMSNIDKVQKELQFIKENATIVLKQIKGVE
jgi:hypothetical protein